MNSKDGKSFDIDLYSDEEEVQVPVRKRDREEERKVNCNLDGTPIHPKGSEYIGTVDVDGYYTGFGQITYPNGLMYLGSFLHGYFHGRGCLKYADGSEYIGEFVNGQHHGKGKVQKIDLYSYEGELFNGRAHGIGTFITKNGVKYTGPFFAGKKHGRAEVICPDRMTVKALFIDGHITHVPLEIIYPDGTNFSGIASPTQIIELQKKFNAGN